MPILLAGGCIFIIVLLINSSYGRAFKAIRDDEIAAEAMGVNLEKHKSLSFVISSFFAGVSGALFAMFATTVQAKVFTSAMTYEILLIVVIGGIGSISEQLLDTCNRVAVIDHHRRAATYIDRADLSFIEPYASSVCELMTEILEMCSDEPKLLRCEAEAILAGIVLDTKSFTLRTGDRTFDAAAYLRRAGADTVAVKKLMQNGMEQTVAKYKILQRAQLYRSMAVAVPETPQNRIVAAQAADELLNVAGVDASMVMYPTEDGGVFVSARSIGDVNVQLIMEKLGGGGNRAAAAAQINGLTLKQAVEKLYAAIDEYIDS